MKELKLVEGGIASEEDLTIPKLIAKCEELGVEGLNLAYKEEGKNELFNVVIYYKKIPINENGEVDA